MDGNGNMNLRSWAFLEPPASNWKNHLGLQLIPSITEKPLFGGGCGDGFREHQNLHPSPSPVMSSINGGPFHHHRVGGISESHIPVEYWMNQNKDYLNMYSGNHQSAYYQSSYGVSPETSSAQSVQMPQQLNLQKTENVMSKMEEVCEEKDDGGGSSGSAMVVKKRGGSKVTGSTPKEKKPRTRTPRAPRDEHEPTPSSNRARTPKKRAEIVINGINMDVSEIPIPVCSCTGAPQQCYRWGSGGWQSACCTTHMSEYPLPPSEKRRGARIAGRKMSIGAFKKVLEKLASEGYNFSNPIDLRSHWAKHGTNKFVTIR
ncbi:protein BASIC PENTACYSTEINE2-like [Salvia hispanica]|uniref:protein BASIC PENTACYSTEINE2-like n=1 Tax=Salvia hispanica TaxID=49212 RepID=UPI0020093656|nr:protein BASIC PENTACYSTEINE2-like [Salvia hispanica]